MFFLISGKVVVNNVSPHGNCVSAVSEHRINIEADGITAAQLLKDLTYLFRGIAGMEIILSIEPVSGIVFYKCAVRIFVLFIA